MSTSRSAWLAAALTWTALLVAANAASASLLATNNSPFPSSHLIVGARWSSPPYAPPANQSGDILPTVWADDGDQYTIMDDGGTDLPASKGFWRQSIARISGAPPTIHFGHVGDPENPPPHTFAQIKQNPTLWQGPLGPYYSSGLVEANHVFFATQELNWHWNTNSPFAGLQGIAYSTDHGEQWQFGNRQFPAPLGNLT
jgi:hypothetical protein